MQASYRVVSITLNSAEFTQKFLERIMVESSGARYVMFSGGTRHFLGRRNPRILNRDPNP